MVNSAPRPPRPDVRRRSPLLRRWTTIRTCATGTCSRGDDENFGAPPGARAPFAPSERLVPAPARAVRAVERSAAVAFNARGRPAGRGALARRWRWDHTRRRAVCVRRAGRRAAPRRDGRTGSRTVCVRARRCVPGSCVRACGLRPCACLCACVCVCVVCPLCGALAAGSLALAAAAAACACESGASVRPAPCLAPCVRACRLVVVVAGVRAYKKFNFFSQKNFKKNHTRTLPVGSRLSLFSDRFSALNSLHLRYYLLLLAISAYRPRLQILSSSKRLWLSRLHVVLSLLLLLLLLLRLLFTVQSLLTTVVATVVAATSSSFSSTRTAAGGVVLLRRHHHRATTVRTNDTITVTAVPGLPPPPPK